MASSTVPNRSNDDARTTRLSPHYLPMDLSDQADRALMQTRGVVAMAMAAIAHGEGYTDDDLINALWLVQEKLESLEKIVSARVPQADAGRTVEGDDEFVSIPVIGKRPAGER